MNLTHCGSDYHASELFLNKFSIALGTNKLFFNVGHAYHRIAPHFLLEHVRHRKAKAALLYDPASVLCLPHSGFHTVSSHFDSLSLGSWEEKLRDI